MDEQSSNRIPLEPLARPSESRLARAFLAGDAAGLARELGPDGIFHSPVRTYAGRAEVQPALEALFGVLRVHHVTGLFLREPEAACFFTADVAGLDGDGALRAVARTGSPPELTLMVRPLHAVVEGVRRIEAGQSR